MRTIEVVFYYFNCKAFILANMHETLSKNYTANMNVSVRETIGFFAAESDAAACERFTR